MVDKNAAAAWELHFNNQLLINCDVEWQDPMFPTLDYGQVIAEEYTRLLKDWEDFYLHGLYTADQQYSTGIGVMAWTDEWDWRPQAFESANALVKPKAKVMVDSLDLVVLRDELDPNEMHRILNNEEIAAEEGWIVRDLKAALLRNYKSGSVTNDGEYQDSEWESYQKQVRDNEADACISTEFKGIRVFHILVREMPTEEDPDGKVTHLILPEDDGLKKFLFKSERRFNEMKNAICFFYYNPSKGRHHSIKGLGHRIFPHCTLSNRLIGHIFDGGIVATGLLLQEKSGSDASKLQLTRMAGYTLLPKDVNLQQTTFQPQFQHLIGLRAMSKEILNNNTGVFRPHSETLFDRQEQKTATQVRAEEAHEARFDKIETSISYVHWDRFHREIFRRLTRREYIESEGDYPGKVQAVKFIERCRKRGVPDELLFDSELVRIRSTRSIGDGSPTMRLNALNMLMGQRPSMDEIGRRNTEREWGAALVGYENVDRFFPVKSRDAIPTIQHSMAEGENIDMVQGNKRTVAIDDVHPTHLKIHVHPLMQTLQMLQEAPMQIDFERSFQFYMLVRPHIDSHLAFLRADPSRENIVKEYDQLMKQIDEGFKIIQKQAEQIARQRQQQQQEAQQAVQNAQDFDKLRDFVLKKYEVDLNHAAQMMREQSMSAVRREKTDVAIESQTRKTQADIENERRKTEADIALKRRKGGE